ncbi:MAG: TA system antitoxin ParD family protein [Rhodoglobus sp.]
MGSTMPTRIDGYLFDSAKAIGAIASRSAAQQLAHWARIGREIEASPATSQRDIQRVLAGESAYDALAERDKAVVRANWDEQVEKRIANLDLAAEFTAAGRSWTDADEQGEPVARTGASVTPRVATQRESVKKSTSSKPAAQGKSTQSKAGKAMSAAKRSSTQTPAQLAQRRAQRPS